jgi:hypothetical protein
LDELPGRGSESTVRSVRKGGLGNDAAGGPDLIKEAVEVLGPA